MRTAAATGPLDQAYEYLSRVVPWPVAGGEPEYVNIHWKYYNEEHGREYWTGKPCTSVQQAVQCVRFQQQKASTRDIYVCMSTQSQTDRRKTKDDREFEVAKRAGANAVRFKSLFADIDVKEGAYANTRDALLAVRSFCDGINLPRPTVLVQSGSGGLHAYWCFDIDLPCETWRPLAHALSSTRSSKLAYTMTLGAPPTQLGFCVYRKPSTIKMNPPRLYYVARSKMTHPTMICVGHLSRFYPWFPRNTILWEEVGSLRQGSESMFHIPRELTTGTTGMCFPKRSMGYRRSNLQ
jgi:hypothetical protein